MSTANTISGLLEKLGDWRTRHSARAALAAIEPGTAANAVVELVRNGEAKENARWAGISLLAEWRYAPANPVLLEILKNEPRLRGEACRALQAITGRDIGEDTLGWERFLNGAEAQATADGAAGVAAELAATSAARDNVDFQLIQEAMKGTAQEISWEAPGYAYVRCPCPEGRKQQVVICFQNDPAGDSTVVAYTESGTVTPAATDAISRRNATIQHGAMFRIEKNAEGQPVVSCRCAVPRSQARPELLREIIIHIAHEADSLESELHGVDLM